MILLSLFNFVGSVVYRFPKFLKNILGKVVFLEPQQQLPNHHTGTNVAIVIGGATKRVEKALELYHKGIIDYFLVTGGIGPYSLNGDALEAKGYADKLTKEGVLKDHIWIEDRSINTYENIKFSMEILTREAKQTNFGFVTPIIITSGFHIKRARALFEHALNEVRHASKFGTNITRPCWAASEFIPCEKDTWFLHEIGCSLVAKEAFRLFTYRLTGKI